MIPINFNLKLYKTNLKHKRLITLCKIIKDLFIKINNK